MHPLRREIMDEDFNSVLYLFTRFKEEGPEDLSLDARAQLIGGILNRTEKTVGFPKMPEVPIEPNFNRADLTTPQLNLLKNDQPKEQSKLTNKPVEAFDKVNEVWICCPRCGSKKIHFGGKDGKKEYCACFDCRVFLNVSKTGEPVITEMKK